MICECEDTFKKSYNLKLLNKQRLNEKMSVGDNGESENCKIKMLDEDNELMIEFCKPAVASKIL